MDWREPFTPFLIERESTSTDGDIATEDSDGSAVCDFTPLHSVMQRVDELDDVRDAEHLRKILRHAVRQLGMSEIAMLEEFLVERTGFGQRTVSTLIKEARNFIEGFGYLHSPDDVIKAFLEGLTQEYRAVVSCGSGIYVYDETSGSFEFITHEELERHLLDEFGKLPLLQREGTVQLVLKRVRLILSDEEFFDDARAGINLRDGFLTLGDDGRPVLLPHSPDHKARVQIDGIYDAQASFDWLDAALRITLPQQPLRDALQEVAGAILFNVRPSKDSVRRMLIFHGARNSGKSTLIGMLESLLPECAVGSVPPGHWNDPNYRAGLENLLLNCVTELGGHTRIGGEHMKKIVSCERIIVRRMRRDPVTITPRAWHLCATNELRGSSTKPTLLSAGSWS